MSSVIALRSGYIVEAYTASWIEIPLSAELESLLPVEAYTASWIEMSENE